MDDFFHGQLAPPATAAGHAPLLAALVHRPAEFGELCPLSGIGVVEHLLAEGLWIAPRSAGTTTAAGRAAATTATAGRATTTSAATPRRATGAASG